ncbi:MAG: hypothetical protein GY759_23390 [Chloroflexi bacterium]|nr:hypothetical protein [Chloroflexota bacterium]
MLGTRDIVIDTNEFSLWGGVLRTYAERPPFGYAQDMPAWTGWFIPVVEKIFMFVR